MFVVSHLRRTRARWTFRSVIASSLCFALGYGCSSDDGGGGDGGNGGSGGTSTNTGSSANTGGTNGSGGSANTGGTNGSGGSANTGGTNGSGTNGGTVGGAGGSAGSDAGGNGGSAGSGASGGTDAGGNGGSAGEVSSGGAGGSGGSGSSTGGTDATGTGGSGEAGAGGDGGEDPLAPRLTDLVLTGVEVPLLPTFDPDHDRYSVLASSPRGDLSLTAEAPSDVDIEVDGVEVESGEAVDLPDAAPGDEILVTVSNDSGDSHTYTVLYLPNNFPRFTVTVRKPSASNDPIYLTPSESGTKFIIKLDNFGVPLYYKAIADSCQGFMKHPNGQMSYNQVTSTGANFIVLDPDFKAVDTVNAIGIKRTDEHEFLILPNGNYVLIGEEMMDHDLSEYGGAADGTAHDNAVQEITPDKQLVFDWNTWGRIPYDENISNTIDDYAHLNSVATDPDGDFIVSSRHQAQVFKIDRDTGDIVWRLGGMSSDFEFVNDTYGGLCGQHAASYVGDGHILVFDNGTPCYPEMPERDRATRAAEFELNETAMTAELVWSYTSPTIRASAEGSAQRLPNGNTFIGWGNNGENPTNATEVNAEGEIVFELEGRLGDGTNIRSYRALRYAD